MHATYSADSQAVAIDTQKTNTQEDTQNIVQMLYNKAINGVVVVTYDQNISIIGLDNLRLRKQVCESIDQSPIYLNQYLLRYHCMRILYISPGFMHNSAAVFSTKSEDIVHGIQEN